VPRHPVIGVMAAELLTQRRVLLLDRSVPVAPAPFPYRFREPADSAGCRPFLDYRVVLPRRPPVMGEPQEVKRPRSVPRPRFPPFLLPRGRANGTSRVLSGWIASPYLPKRFGSTSITRRASDSSVNWRVRERSPLLQSGTPGYHCSDSHTRDRLLVYRQGCHQAEDGVLPGSKSD